MSPDLWFVVAVIGLSIATVGSVGFLTLNREKLTLWLLRRFKAFRELETRATVNRLYFKPEPITQLRTEAQITAAIYLMLKERAPQLCVRWVDVDIVGREAHVQVQGRSPRAS